MSYYKKIVVFTNESSLIRRRLLGEGDNGLASKNSFIGRRRQQYLLGIEREKDKKVERQ